MILIFLSQTYDMINALISMYRFVFGGLFNEEKFLRILKIVGIFW